MKAIIPVAGAGTQLRPLTYTQPKPLIPIAGKPIISHILDKLITAGIEDFVFVTGYMGEKIELFLDENYPDIRRHYVVQSQRKGLGHAIWKAHEHIENDEDIVIVLGDTIVDLDLLAFLKSETSILGVKKVEDPRQFGVVELDESGSISRVVEKPKIPKSNLGIAGIYKIRESKSLFTILENNINKDIKTHDEIQLTDAIDGLLKKGVEINAMEVDNWYDCGQKDILLETNAKKLEGVEQRYAELYPDSIIIPPVSIGEGCEIHHSIIGPYVSIGSRTSVKDCLIRNTIIGSYCRLTDVSLEASVIGQDVTINGMHQSLNIGDNTEIDFSK